MVQAFIFDLSLVRKLHSAAAEHADQAERYDLVALPLEPQRT